MKVAFKRCENSINTALTSNPSPPKSKFKLADLAQQCLLFLLLLLYPSCVWEFSKGNSFPRDQGVPLSLQIIYEQPSLQACSQGPFVGERGRSAREKAACADPIATQQECDSD